MFVALVLLCFFFKQKTAYEMRISDWSSDVCSSDLLRTCAFGWQRCNIRGGRIGELEHFGIFCLADDPAVMYRTAIVHRDIIEQAPGSLQIGRASCRERVCQYV